VASGTYVCRDAEVGFKACWSNVEETEDIFRGRALDRVVAWQRCSSCCLSYISSDKNGTILMVRPRVDVFRPVYVWRQHGNQLRQCHNHVCFAFYQLQHNQRQYLIRNKHESLRQIWQNFKVAGTVYHRLMLMRHRSTHLRGIPRSNRFVRWTYLRTTNVLLHDAATQLLKLKKQPLCASAPRKHPVSMLTFANNNNNNNNNKRQFIRRHNMRGTLSLVVNTPKMSVLFKFHMNQTFPEY